VVGQTLLRHGACRDHCPRQLRMEPTRAIRDARKIANMKRRRLREGRRHFAEQWAETLLEVCLRLGVSVDGAAPHTTPRGALPSTKALTACGLASEVMRRLHRTTVASQPPRTAPMYGRRSNRLAHPHRLDLITKRLVEVNRGDVIAKDAQVDACRA
jgi:hypothetical protein